MDKNALQLAVIFDIDNCLVDSTVLNQYLPNDVYSREAWRLVEVHYPEVIPNQWAVDLVNMYRNSGYTIIFVTGREEADNCRDVTINTISKALNGDLNNIYLFMRGFQDYRLSAEVKKDIYLKEIKGAFDIRLAVDDEPLNCIMFNSLNIPTLQVII